MGEVGVVEGEVWEVASPVVVVVVAKDVNALADFKRILKTLILTSPLGGGSVRGGVLALLLDRVTLRSIWGISTFKLEREKERCVKYVGGWVSEVKQRGRVWI